MKEIFSRLLGEPADSPQVLHVIRQFGLHEVEEDPPLRRYIGSKASGLDLLVEDDHVLATQIFVKAVQGFSSFQGALPYGLQRDMKRSDVHQLLGNPSASDEFDSQYENIEPGIKLVINFAPSSDIAYLNLFAMDA